MTERDDIDMLAAEYVLGTLDASERASVAARRQREPLLGAGHRRLAATPRATRRDDRARHCSARRSSLRNRTTPGCPPRATSPSAEIIRLSARVKRWRRTALAASALAASLALAIGLRETVLAPQPQNFVAVFQKDDALPSFLLSIDLATRQLTIRPVAAEPQAGKTYQLWIASEQLGPAPQSLGLLEEAKAPTRKSLATFDPALLAKATFGVSIEPPGGSPTGRPSGNPLHAKLYPAVP